MNDQLGPLPPHRKVTAHGRVWIEEDMLAYGRQERAAERMMTQCLLEENERLRAERAAKQATIDRLMLEYCPNEMTPAALWDMYATDEPAAKDG